MSEHMTAKQAAEYLRVCQRTIYNLVKNKELDAVKTHRGLRIKWSRVVALGNYRRRIKYPGRVFTFALMTRYHQARQKYDIITRDKGAVGWLGLQDKYVKGLSKKKLVREYFKPIKYHRVRLEGRFAIMVVRHCDFDRLPRAEQRWWLGFEMKPDRIREEIKK